MSNSYPEDDLDSLLGGYPDPDPFPFSIQHAGAGVYLDQHDAYSALTLDSMSVDSGPRLSVDENYFDNLFHGPVSGLSHSYNLPAPVADDVAISVPQPGPGASVPEILQFFDALLPPPAEAQTQLQLPHPLIVDVGSTAQLTLGATADSSNVVSPIPQLGWPSYEYMPPSPHSSPSPSGLGPYSRYMQASARAQAVTSGPSASLTFRPIATPESPPSTKPRTTASKSSGKQRRPLDSATSLATEYVCHWVVDPNSPNGICGHKHTGRAAMWKEHLHTTHAKWGIEIRDGETRKLCGWEGCGLALKSVSCKRDHLMTHLKDQEGGAGAHRRHRKKRVQPYST